MFLNPTDFFQYLWDMRNLQEEVKTAFCYQKLFWPFTVWINCSSDLKIFENSRPSASNFKSFSRSLEQFFLTVGQYNFGNKLVTTISTTFFLMSSEFQMFCADYNWTIFIHFFINHFDPFFNRAFILFFCSIQKGP